MHTQVSQATARAEAFANALQSTPGQVFPSTVAKSGPVAATDIQTVVRVATGVTTPGAAGPAAASSPSASMTYTTSPSAGPSGERSRANSPPRGACVDTNTFTFTLFHLYTIFNLQLAAAMTSLSCIFLQFQLRLPQQPRRRLCLAQSARALSARSVRVQAARAPQQQPPHQLLQVVENFLFSLLLRPRWHNPAFLV